MKKLFFFVFLFLVCLLIKDNPTVESIDMVDYCYVPPSIGQIVSPNVLLVIDESGSMSWCAYNPTSSKNSCCNTSTGCGWTYQGTEEGYFVPDKLYRYNSSQGYWEETTGTATTCPKRAADINTSENKYQGSCLNFIYMRRIDLLRWALTGGKPDSCTSNNIKRCDPEVYGTPGDQLTCDSYGCILSSASGQKVRVPWSRITGEDGGLLFQVKNFTIKPRFGVMFFSDDSVRGNKAYIGDFTSSANYDAVNPYKNTITLVNYESPSGYTPIAPALWDAYNYFAQNSPQYGGFNPSSGSDNWKNPLYQCFDDNNDGNCQGNEIKPVACAKNFIILLTDGQWNRGGKPVGSACSIDVGYESASADPVVPAYWLHKKGFTNLVDGRTGNYYVDSLYGIGLWLGGTGELSLKNVSMYGSFDRSKTWPGNLSGYPMNYSSSVDDCCSSSNCGRGSPATPLPPSSIDWDKNSDGNPDTFYSASNAIEIKDAIKNAILDILRRASSGATVATLTTKTGFSSLIIQPYYYPIYQTQEGTELSWLGFLRSIWIDFRQNLRENTQFNEYLDLVGSPFDKIIKFITDNKETKVALLQGDSEIGTNKCKLDNTKGLDQLIPVFDASCNLANTGLSTRVIKYNSGSGLVDFKTDQASSLLSIWQAVDSNINSDVKAQCIIRYLRGENVANDPDCSNLPNIKRPREINLSTNQICTGISEIKTWKLGDIIHSTPSVVSNEPVNIYHKKYNDVTYQEFINGSAYRNRQAIVFVGANDGMLHAFRIGTVVSQASADQPAKLQNAPNDTGTDKIGKEEWAFIPRNALPYLAWYGKEDYKTCHVPTVDYRTFIFDAKINGSWKTLLVGVMGFGGKAIPENNPQYSSSIFVLDITDPLNPSLLWERALYDKTLTLSFPAVVKVGDNWYVVAGTGPKEPQGTSFTTAKLYFFNLNNGTDAREPITISSGLNAAVGDIMPIDLDYDYSDDALYFGVYTTNSGDFYRLVIKNGIANAQLSKAMNVSRPIFAAPTFTKDEDGNFWVFFGTGRFLGDSDKIIEYTNYLVGFKDPCWNGSCSSTYNVSALYNSTNFTMQGIITAIKQVCNCSASSCGLVDVAYKTTPISSMPDLPERGWRYEFNDPKEAIISQPIVYGGILDALSFEPSGDICIAGGTTNLLALHYKYGVANPQPAIYSTLAVQGNIAIGETVTIKPKISLGPGSPPIGNPFQISASRTGEIRKIIQISTGFIYEIPQKGTGGGRFISWIEK